MGRALCATSLTAVLLAGSAPVSAAPLWPRPSTPPADPGCELLAPNGRPGPIKHVVHVQFDNVHFTRDIPSVPSDLEQMPHLLRFIEGNGTLLGNEHTPLIAHTANNLITGLTGVYGDQHGIPISNSFEYYNNSSVGAYNTSAFTYWTDPVAPDPADAGRQLPFQMIDSSGKNLSAPWVPFVKAGCNFGAVSTVNMVLENNGNDVQQVFGAGSPEAGESSADKTNDFVGVAVHCADQTCASVGSGARGHAKAELGGQGLGALYGHKYVASQVSQITMTDGTPITGFNQANGFNPTPSYTLGYMASLLEANVPIVYGYVADAHDSRVSCAVSSPANPVVTDTNNGQPCGVFAPGEAGYVDQLKAWDAGFDQFFTRLNKEGINQSNTLFVFQADENDHYTGSAPLNPGCDGVRVVCRYDRTQVGEVTTDLPLLMKNQGLYDFGMSGGTGTTAGTARPGFDNTDAPYAIDFDTAPGFWLKGHPGNGSAQLRKLEGGLARVTSPNPYTNTSTEQLFRFLVDQPGLRALHMITGDNNRTAGVVGFTAEDHFVQTTPLIGASNTSTCNRFPSPTDPTCTSNSFIWLHGNYAEDIDHTWAGLAGPGVLHRGVDSTTWTDHTDLRPTLMTLVCLKDDYAYEGRAVLEDLQDSALPRSVAAARGALTDLGRAYKQLNAPVGAFGQAAIQLSTLAIRGTDQQYSRLERQLASDVTLRDQAVSRMQAELGRVPGCDGLPRQTPGRNDMPMSDFGRAPDFDFGRLGELTRGGDDSVRSMQDHARGGQR